MALTAFIVGAVVIFILIIEACTPEGPKTYIPRKQRPPKSLWLKAFCAAFHRLMARLEKTILNMKVRRSYRPPKPWTYGRRTRQKTHRRASLAQVTNMTSTWFNPGAATHPSARQFDSDSHDLMLDDGASACITNCEDDFVEPPKRVNRKVKGIKGHADATHRGTIKWYLEDDAGLVHILIMGGLPYSRCGDSDFVSTTPRTTSKRSLPQGRRYRFVDHEQSHHTFLVTETLHEDSPA